MLNGEAERMLELIGLRPVLVDDLGRDAILLPENGLVLIDCAASRHRCPEITGLILSKALSLATR